VILAFVFAYLAYQKAIASERNGIKWAAIVAGAYIGIQICIQFGMGIIVGIYDVSTESNTVIFFETYWLVPIVISSGLSIFVAWLILRYLDKVPEEQLFTPPPPPPNFN
jgi:Na+/H+ antiporter NhaA